MGGLLNLMDLRVAIGRDRVPVLRGVDLSIHRGEVAGLVGQSGAGKSMVGKAILGILPLQARVTGGQAQFNGHDLLSLRGKRRRQILGRQIALIPQDPMTALNPVRRIGSQLTDGLRLHLRLSRAEARKKALGLLDEVHIHDPERILRSYPHELSGGMRQRVLIASAFSCEPQLIIADEPTTALDVTVQRQILRLIREMQAAHGTAVLFITHDLGVVAKICDTVTVLFAGQVLEQAPTETLFRNPGSDYTRALFAATPRWDRPDQSLIPVPDTITASLLASARAEDARQ